MTSKTNICVARCSFEKLWGLSKFWNTRYTLLQNYQLSSNYSYFVIIFLWRVKIFLNKLYVLKWLLHFLSFYSFIVFHKFIARQSIICSQKYGFHFFQISVSFSLHAKFLKNLLSVESSFREEDQSAVHLQLKDLVSNLHSMPEVQVLGGSRGPAGQLICR